MGQTSHARIMRNLASSLLLPRHALLALAVVAAILVARPSSAAGPASAEIPESEDDGFGVPPAVEFATYLSVLSGIPDVVGVSVALTGARRRIQGEAGVWGFPFYGSGAYARLGYSLRVIDNRGRRYNGSTLDIPVLGGVHLVAFECCGNSDTGVNLDLTASLDWTRWFHEYFGIGLKFTLGGMGGYWRESSFYGGRSALRLDWVPIARLALGLHF